MSGLNLYIYRPYSSVAEHFLGKEEVGGSIPLVGSIYIFVVCVSYFDFKGDITSDGKRKIY